MKKVTIEITESGWQTKIEINGQTYIQNYVGTKTGANADCCLDDFPIPDNLYEAIAFSSLQIDTMKSLKKIK